MGHSRPDKRSATQLRTMGCVIGMLSRADGSARFSLGDSNVLCSVYGPTAARARDERLDQACIQVVFNPVSGASGTQERMYERHMGLYCWIPVSMEVSEAQSIHTLMFDTTTSEVMGIDSTGLFDTEEFDSCYELSKLAASSIHSFMRAAIERKIKKEQGVDSQ
ncbi:hypothetical protein BASA60_007017 [Batrachochytrium salamandrivorans]|nr:hypothetical protein BASA60_007017 [Batrachochytrium salamandrivorans]